MRDVSWLYGTAEQPARISRISTPLLRRGETLPRGGTLTPVGTYPHLAPPTPLARRWSHVHPTRPISPGRNEGAQAETGFPRTRSWKGVVACVGHSALGCKIWALRDGGFPV